MKHFDNQQKRRRVTRLALLKLKSNKKHMVTREILLGRPEFIYIFLDNENSLDEYKKRKGEREKELEFMRTSYLSSTILSFWIYNHSDRCSFIGPRPRRAWCASAFRI